MIQLTLLQASSVRSIANRIQQLERAKDEEPTTMVEIEGMSVPLPEGFARRAIDAEIAKMHAELAKLGVQIVFG